MASCIALYRQINVYCTLCTVSCTLCVVCTLHIAHCWFGWTEYWILNTYVVQLHLDYVIRFNCNLWMQQQSLNAMQGYALSLNSSLADFEYFFFQLSLHSFRISPHIWNSIRIGCGFVKNFTNLFNSKQSFRNERFNNFSAFFLELILLYIYFYVAFFYLFPDSVAYRISVGSSGNDWKNKK